MARKIWITAAVTGGIHTPSMSDYLPIEPEQIIEDAVGAAEAGASVLHMHVRTPKTGKPITDINLMREVCAEVSRRCDAIICVTTGGALGMSIEERIAPIPELKPEIASLNSGSINFVLSPAVEVIKRRGIKFEWEESYLEGTYDGIFSNTYKAFEKYCVTMNEVNTRPEFEVYDIGMVNNLAFFIQKGVIKTPPYIQFVMGIQGGIPASVDHLCHLVRTAKEQIGEFHWSCAAAGRYQFPMAAATLAMGGNVRVGLEDNLYLRPGVFAKSSAEQVRQVKALAQMVGLEVFNSNEVREILALKGKKSVGF